MINQNELHRLGNTLGLLVICIILSIAFAGQFYHHDLPCPLCLLQRVSLVGVGICLCMNLKNGIRIAHYGFMILAALIGFSIALRQVFLHLAPGDVGYGHAILGFHLYIWSSIIFILIIGFIAIAMIFERGFAEHQPKPTRKNMLLIGFFLVLILANGISTFIECGFLVCPADPAHYRLLN